MAKTRKCQECGAIANGTQKICESCGADLDSLEEEMFLKIKKGVVEKKSPITVFETIVPKDNDDKIIRDFVGSAFHPFSGLRRAGLRRARGISRKEIIFVVLWWLISGAIIYAVFSQNWFTAVPVSPP